MKTIMKCSMNESFVLEVENEGKFLSFKIIGHMDSPTVYLDKYSVSVLKSLRVKEVKEAYSEQVIEQHYSPRYLRRLDLIECTGLYFCVFMEEIAISDGFSKPISTQKLYDKYMDSRPYILADQKSKLTITKFYEWLDAFGEYFYGQAAFKTDLHKGGSAIYFRYSKAVFDEIVSIPVKTNI